jgi:hypothetical protein
MEWDLLSSDAPKSSYESSESIYIHLSREFLLYMQYLRLIVFG